MGKNNFDVDFIFFRNHQPKKPINTIRAGPITITFMNSFNNHSVSKVKNIQHFRLRSCDF